MDKPKLLSEAQVTEIRTGVREGIRGPVMLKWVEQLLADRDERIRLADGPGEPNER